jgi:hypothetical protein
LGQRQVGRIGYGDIEVAEGFGRGYASTRTQTQYEEHADQYFKKTFHRLFIQNTAQRYEKKAKGERRKAIFFAFRGEKLFFPNYLTRTLAYIKKKLYLCTQIRISLWKANDKTTIA